MSSVLWAKTQQLQEDAFRQLQNIYGELIYSDWLELEKFEEFSVI